MEECCGQEKAKVGVQGKRRKPEQEPGCEDGEARVGAGQDRQTGLEGVKGGRGWY